MLYSLLFAGGKGAAKNPGLSFGGSGEHSALSSMDPIGNFITGFGGDPLNLYGNKNNPNALLFPSSPQTNSASPSPLFNIGVGGGQPGPSLPPVMMPPTAQRPPSQGLNFQGMPGYGTASGGGQPPQQQFNPFLAALMQYTNPPKPPAPTGGGGAMRGGMMNPGVMQQLAQMRGGNPMNRMRQLQ